MMMLILITMMIMINATIITGMQRKSLTHALVWLLVYVQILFETHPSEAAARRHLTPRCLGGPLDHPVKARRATGVLVEVGEFTTRTPS